ncbi:cell division protein ZapA, partial [Pseudomonas frederiksbergensis]
MRHGADGIKVVSILGEDYSIKAPAGEEQTLLDAALMLKAVLAETKKKY